MTVSVTYLDPLTYYAKDDRRLQTALRGQQGVMFETHLKVTQRSAGANMSVDVASGWCVVVGSLLVFQMDYLVLNDATMNLPISSAHATLQRNDIVCVRVWDNAVDGTTFNKADIVVIQGEPGAGDPTVPADCLPLARVRVEAAVTSIVSSKIDDRRDPFTFAALQYTPVFGRQLLGIGGISASFNTSASTTDVSPSTVGGANSILFNVPYENTLAHSFRRYEIGGQFAVVSSGADDVAAFKIQIDGVTLNDSFVGKGHIRVASQALTISITAIITGASLAAGQHTLSVVFNRAAGSGTLTAGTCQWWVRDIGQAGL